MPMSEFPYNSTAVQMFLQFRGASVDNMKRLTKNDQQEITEGN